MALLRAREAAMRSFRPMLATHDLTEQQWRVLRALAAADGPLAIGEVAERTFLLGPSLSRIVADLQSRRLIDRALSSGDQRRSNLQLAAEGRSLVEQIAPESEAVYNVIEARFDVDRLDRLLRELHDFVGSMDAANTVEP
jgi:homoprotocatechuate degradation regulator HpaR